MSQDSRRKRERAIKSTEKRKWRGGNGTDRGRRGREPWLPRGILGPLRRPTEVRSRVRWARYGKTLNDRLTSLRSLLSFCMYIYTPSVQPKLHPRREPRANVNASQCLKLVNIFESDFIIRITILFFSQI